MEGEIFYEKFDFTLTPREQVAEIIKRFPLQPGYAVLVGGGMRAWWVLKEPFADVTSARAALRNLTTEIATQFRPPQHTGNEG